MSGDVRGDTTTLALWWVVLGLNSTTVQGE